MFEFCWLDTHIRAQINLCCDWCWGWLSPLPSQFLNKDHTNLEILMMYLWDFWEMRLKLWLIFHKVSLLFYLDMGSKYFWVLQIFLQQSIAWTIFCKWPTFIPSKEFPQYHIFKRKNQETWLQILHLFWISLPHLETEGFQLFYLPSQSQS